MTPNQVADSYNKLLSETKQISKGSSVSISNFVLKQNKFIESGDVDVCTHLISNSFVENILIFYHACRMVPPYYHTRPKHVTNEYVFE